VADGVDAPVDAVQGAGLRPPCHGGLAEPEKLQLPQADNAVLAFRQDRNGALQWKVSTKVNPGLTNV
jgi:hypothetical protein